MKIWNTIKESTDIRFTVYEIKRDYLIAGRNTVSDARFESHIIAPEFTAGLEWINTDNPLTLKERRGKIVILDFWTCC